jgi:hypothetical protein
LVLSSGSIVARELLANPRPAPAGDAGPAERASAPRKPEDEPQPVAEPRQEPVLAVAPVPSEALKANLPAIVERHGPERYDFEALIARFRDGVSDKVGRRLCVIGTKSGSADELALSLGRTLARRERALLVEIDGESEADRPGFSDLVAGDASFLDVIEREPGSRLHRIASGGFDLDFLVEESEAAEIALAALGETYDWVVCRLNEPQPDLLALFAARVDAVVIASEDDAASPDLVDLYDAVRRAGAPDVVVAREKPVVAEAA